MAFHAHPAPELPDSRAPAPARTYRYGPGGQLTVTTRADRDGAVLTVSGELDIAVATELGTRVDAALAQGHVRLVLDLRDLTFCDCAGLTAFLRARRSATELNGWVRLAAVHPRVARIIQIAGLATAFPCHLDNAAAFNGSLPSPPADKPVQRARSADPPTIRSRPPPQRPPPVALARDRPTRVSTGGNAQPVTMAISVATSVAISVRPRPPGHGHYALFGVQRRVRSGRFSMFRRPSSVSRTVKP